MHPLRRMASGREEGADAHRDSLHQGARRNRHITERRMSAVLRRVFAAITILSAFICAVASAAGIKVESRLDRKRHLAGEPVYLILRYTNDGTAVARFEQQDLYCMEPSLEPTSLRPEIGRA